MALNLPPSTPPWPPPSPPPWPSPDAPMAPHPPDGPSSADAKARNVELLISVLLRIGVIASLLVVNVGMVLTFVHHPEYLRSRADLARLTSPSRAVFAHTWHDLLAGMRHGEGRAVVIAGVLLLIATPVVRVAASIFAFIYERDWRFVVITSIVLTLLLLSFVIGRATE